MNRRQFQPNSGKKMNLSQSSHNTTTSEYEEDEVDNLLSEEDSQDFIHLETSDRSNDTTFDRSETSTQYQRNISYDKPIKLQKVRPIPQKQPPVTPSGLPVNKCIIVAFVVGISCVFAAVLKSNPIPNRELNRFNDLKEYFPNQPRHFWRALEIGLANSLNLSMEAPNVILFLFNGDEFPQELFNGIVEITKDSLGTNIDPVELTRTDLSSEEIEKDHGVVLSIYTPKLIRSRFMIVRDINDIPGKTARAFHYFCDVYNPTVKRANIFFTMKVNDFVSAENATKVADNLLRSVWNELKSTDLGPLIGRVTDDVLVIN